MRCPTSRLEGSNNSRAIGAALAHYRDQLASTRVTLEIVDGLIHPQELVMIDRIFSPLEMTLECERAVSATEPFRRCGKICIGTDGT